MQHQTGQGWRLIIALGIHRAGDKQRWVIGIGPFGLTIKAGIAAQVVKYPILPYPALFHTPLIPNSLDWWAKKQEGSQTPPYTGAVNLP